MRTEKCQTVRNFNVHNRFAKPSLFIWQCGDGERIEKGLLHAALVPSFLSNTLLLLLYWIQENRFYAMDFHVCLYVTVLCSYVTNTKHGLIPDPVTITFEEYINYTRIV